ncbi:FIG00872625: hypothetical protein [Richelia intracellularis HH01]|uniref:Uncharacterized protein n=1 Tax=Richelia intracellularis HH01 TaxID=1165094 RepID=M1WTT6_9NOST|nr:hypothetical protein [Richelia intracellularis]CCH68379.1 FIG00872625: hypothetical protein [Richelia intracellularis HH01]
MKIIRPLTSACKYCRHYKPEGRRGGVCQQLGTPVKGKWAACSLAIPPFIPSWESLEDVWHISEKTKLKETGNGVMTKMIRSNNHYIYNKETATT